MKKLSLQILGQPDPNHPREVHWVGHYALGVTWADGHGSIYPFEPLRRGCACGVCAARSRRRSGSAITTPRSSTS